MVREAPIAIEQIVWLLRVDSKRSRTGYSRHKPPFARTITRTLRRRFYSGCSHSIRDGERCFIGAAIQVSVKLSVAHGRFRENRMLDAGQFCLQGLPLRVKGRVRFFSPLADIGAHLQAALLVWS